MSVNRLRVLFFLAGGLAGALILRNLESGFSYWAGMLGGFLISAVVILLELSMDKISIKETALGALGLMFGLLLAFLIALPISFLVQDSEGQRLSSLILYFFFGYLGMMLGIKRRQEIPLFDPAVSVSAKVLDTSVIIDGRVAEIADTGFLEGTLLVPRFILQELQHIADSSDSSKRSRGRRGLDILNRMQKSANISVKIYDKDFSHIVEVDEKLVEVGKLLQLPILTNDFNLNKVAKLQGVKVLNINDLSNALKPQALPGEILAIKIIKEGKESGQGVAYLEDGTMVVVDNGRSFIGQTIQAVVTSVLQTAAGRMIFARKEEMSERTA